MPKPKEMKKQVPEEKPPVRVFVAAIDDPTPVRTAKDLSDAWMIWAEEFALFMTSKEGGNNEVPLSEAGKQLYQFLYTDTDKQCVSIPQELLEYEVSLDADPASLGLGTLNEKLATIQSFKDRISNLGLQTIALLNRDWERFQYEVEAVMSCTFDRDLSSVKMREMALKNKEQQAAQINTWHSELVQLKVFVEDGSRQVKWLSDLIKERLKNLESVNSNASRQITVVQLMVETGEIKRGDRPYRQE